MTARRLDTSYTRLTWSDDGGLVTKRRTPSPIARRQFRNERRVNRLLLLDRPPLPTPSMAADDAQHLSLTFEALDGEPLGPKYPAELAADDVAAIAGLAAVLATYSPRRRWMRRLDSVRRLRMAERAGLLTTSQAVQLVHIAARAHRRTSFAHGDLTARNVLRTRDGPVLIDWEWAGLYPPGYDLAFLWFSLREVPAGRAAVEARRSCAEDAFLLSALLVQLWHLQWYVPDDFLVPHRATRDELLGRLLT